MARTARKVESLLDEEPGLADALSTVLERTDGGEAEVEWADVRDDLSSGEWGRLIETGILVDGEEGFVLDDAEAVRDVLDDGSLATTPSTGGDDESDDGVTWSIWDKAAAVGSIGLFAGYSIGAVRSVVGNVIDLVLHPLDAVLPFYVVVMILAVFTGLYSTLLQSNLMDMDEMGEYQERMQEIQERRKEAKERGDEEALERIQQEQMEAMGDQLGMFKVQFKPMVWIMLLTIPVFLWMYWKILPRGSGQVIGPEPTMVMPLVGELESWTAGVAGPIQAWIVWYFLCSMAFSQVIRKALDIQTTPSTS